MTNTCALCGKPLPARQPGQPGRPPSYCSPEHKHAVARLREQHRRALGRLVETRAQQIEED